MKQESVLRSTKMYIFI